MVHLKFGQDLLALADRDNRFKTPNLEEFIRLCTCIYGS